MERNRLLQAEENERIRVESKRKLVLDKCDELKTLRRAIQNATVSKANHDMIVENIERSKRER